MPQLSILIPFFEEESKLESTLVSVLENRPYSCEVIVAHQGSYSDPYNLSDEVRFVEFERNQFHLSSIVSQIAESVDSPVLHLLACGVQVQHGWTNDLVEAFDDPYVGMVSPVVLNADDSVYCVGVENSFLYRNQMVGHGQFLTPQDYESFEPVGPSQLAAFYRTDAIQEVTFLDELSQQLFGMELGLALEAIGYENKVLGSSILKWDEQQDKKSLSMFVDPVDSQKAVWRFSGSYGFFQGLAVSTMGLCADLLGAPFAKASRQSLMARLSHFVCSETASTFAEFVEEARGPLPAGSTVSIKTAEMGLSGSEIEQKRAA